MATIVRQAALHDLDRLVPLFDGYRVFYGKPSNPTVARDFLHNRISRSESLVLIAEDARGNTVGFAQLYPSFSSVRAAPILILNDLFVAQSARRGGVGAALLAAAADLGRVSGAARLKLSTAITNTAAQRLYDAMGWKRDDEFCEYGLTL
jgi:GNAT superfamily N-acetyltransferase